MMGEADFFSTSPPSTTTCAPPTLCCGVARAELLFSPRHRAPRDRGGTTSSCTASFSPSRRASRHPAPKVAPQDASLAQERPRLIQLSEAFTVVTHTAMGAKPPKPLAAETKADASRPGAPATPHGAAAAGPGAPNGSRFPSCCARVVV